MYVQCSQLQQLYLSLVHPHLEYACQLWDPYTQNDINKLESVQKFTLKLISHRWDASYEELTRLVNVQKVTLKAGSGIQDCTWLV